MSLVCKVCSDSSAYIRNEARLKGMKKGMINVDNYSDGVESIHLVANIKNIKLKLHLIAHLLQLEQAFFGSKISHHIEDYL